MHAYKHTYTHPHQRLLPSQISFKANANINVGVGGLRDKYETNKWPIHQLKTLLLPWSNNSPKPYSGYSTYVVDVQNLNFAPMTFYGPHFARALWGWRADPRWACVPAETTNVISIFISNRFLSFQALDGKVRMTSEQWSPLNKSSNWSKAQMQLSWAATPHTFTCIQLVMWLDAVWILGVLACLNVHLFIATTVIKKKKKQSKAFNLN